METRGLLPDADEGWMDADDLLAYLELPRERLYYELLWRQLGGHMSPASQSVLDVGAGRGFSAVRMSQLGHAVTAIEPDPDALTDAIELARDSDQPVRLLQGGVEDVFALIEAHKFSWVLCHNVLEFVEHPEQAVHNLGAVLEAGGYLSLVIRNPYSKLLLATILEKDPIAARHTLRETLGMSLNHDPDAAKAFTFEQAQGWLRSAGLSIVARYGIRTVYDYVRSEAVKIDPEWHAAVRALERDAGRVSPLRDIAAHIHLVAQKRTP